MVTEENRAYFKSRVGPTTTNNIFPRVLQYCNAADPAR